jgi:ferredoxin-NADP reductase
MTAWLDRLLGRVTMYGLLIIWLGVLGVAALVLTLIPGTVSFSPLALLASATVLLVVSYLANGLAGLIFRTRPQLSSTVITALLLLFIFTPSIDPLPLAGLALAALVAVVTKYLLAWRGRHIFNPAAAAAFIVGMPGLPFGFATWWVGTTPLVVVAAIGAFTMLFRTRRLWLGVSYVATVVVVWQVRGLLTATPPLDVLNLALLTLPTVFFAGFMLSEPLTLPPRRWQQLAEAVLVGVIASIAFTFGPIYSSPQLALLIGNLLAFLVGQRRGIRLRFLERRQLTPTSWDFAFEPVAPVRFRAGQYMELTLPHRGTDARGWRRVFSIATAPESGEVRFGVRLPDKPSSFKTALMELTPGAPVSATSVSGDFVLPRDPAQKVLLVAGGIGVTPFVGQLQEAAVERNRRDIVLVYAVSSAAELAYAAELEATGFPVVVVCPDEPEALPAGWTWVGPRALSADIVHAHVPDARDRVAYVSGPPNLVSALRRALRGTGVRRVHTDSFIGY